MAKLNNSQDLNSVAAIGKMASLGTNGILHEEGKSNNFEIYFQSEIQSGNLTIMILMVMQ